MADATSSLPFSSYEMTAMSPWVPYCSPVGSALPPISGVKSAVPFIRSPIFVPVLCRYVISLDAFARKSWLLGRVMSYSPGDSSGAVLASVYRTAARELAGSIAARLCASRVSGASVTGADVLGWIVGLASVGDTPGVTPGCCGASATSYCERSGISSCWTSYCDRSGRFWPKYCPNRFKTCGRCSSLALRMLSRMVRGVPTSLVDRSRLTLPPLMAA